MDYPIPDPDPAWDYANIRHSTQQTKLLIEELLKYLADIEDATPESNNAVRDKLESIQVSVEGALALLNT
jgi:hypothetical protein